MINKAYSQEKTSEEVDGQQNLQANRENHCDAEHQYLSRE